MAIILFRCPYCSKKVETPEENVGREGLCPGCQKIFEIPEPSKKEPTRAARPAAGIGLAAGDAPEYGELPVLVGVGVVFLGLLALLGTTFLPWLQHWANAVDVVAGQKALVVVGTAASVLFLLVSALTRKSLMPPVLTGAAWGMFALIWTGSIWRTLGKAATEGSQSPLSGGLYLAMGACLLVLAGAAFVYYQVHDGPILQGFGFFLVITQVLALVVALLLASHRLKPALLAAPQAQQGVLKQPGEPAPKAPGPRGPAGPNAPEQEPAAEE